MLRTLTLPTVKNPNLEVSNFLQPPETLTWLSNAAGDLGKTESTGGKGKEMKAMQVYVWGGWGRGEKDTDVQRESVGLANGLAVRNEEKR